MIINKAINKEIGRLKLENEAMRMVLATVANKAGVSGQELTKMLELTENDIRQSDQNVVVN